MAAMVQQQQQDLPAEGWVDSAEGQQDDAGGRDEVAQQERGGGVVLRHVLGVSRRVQVRHRGNR